ncbi:hypothetical protein ACSQ67_024776 [Phaseolus vulgaris]
MFLINSKWVVRGVRLVRGMRLGLIGITHLKNMSIALVLDNGLSRHWQQAAGWDSDVQWRGGGWWWMTADIDRGSRVKNTCPDTNLRY